MFSFTWTLPWRNPQTLLGILTTEEVDILFEDGHYQGSIISIGLLLCRIDIIINEEKID